MPKYVFYYGIRKAFGEGPRLLMAFGGQEFEDIRLTVEQWSNFKTSKLFIFYHTYNI